MPIATDIEKIQMIISEVLMDEFEAQGHYMTGKLINDLEFKVRYEPNETIIEGFMYPYANYLARGVSKDKIPFSGTKARGKGTGGVSQYIQALQRYAQARMGVSEKESLGVAFAIAKTQKKEGMPTQGSYKYSSTGKRTAFVGDALEKGQDRIGEAVSEMSAGRISVSLDALISKYQLELNT